MKNKEFYRREKSKTYFKAHHGTFSNFMMFSITLIMLILSVNFISASVYDYGTKCKDITLTSALTTDNVIVEYNITGIEFLNTSEIKIIYSPCLSFGYQVKSTVLGNGSDWAKVTFLANLSGDKQYSVYYNTTNHKTISLELVDDFCEFNNETCDGRWKPFKNVVDYNGSVTNGILNFTGGGIIHNSTDIGKKNVLIYSAWFNGGGGSSSSSGLTNSSYSSGGGGSDVALVTAAEGGNINWKGALTNITAETVTVITGDPPGSWYWSYAALNSSGGLNMTLYNQTRAKGSKSTTKQISPIDELSLYILTANGHPSSIDFIRAYDLEAIFLGNLTLPTLALGSQEEVPELPTDGFYEEYQTFNASTYETKSETFIINLTYNSTHYTSVSANLNYNGTIYAGTKSGSGNSITYSKSMNIPLGAASNNFSWVVSLTNSSGTYSFSSQDNNQTVSQIELGYCNSTLNKPYINFTFQDESDSTSITAEIDSSTWNYWIGDGTINKTFNYINNTANETRAFCFSPTDTAVNVGLTFKYSNDSYPQRTYTLNNYQLTNVTKNQTLTLLKSISGSYVTFQLVNPSNQVLSGVSIIGTTSIGGIQTIIVNGVTDSSGIIQFWLNPDALHTFNFSKSGFSTVTQTIYPSQASYTITLGEITSSTITDYSLGINITINPSKDTELYNDTTYNFNYSISSSYWALESFGFSLKLNNGTTIGSTSSSSSGGIISINLDTLNYNEIIMEYNWTINGTTESRRTTWTISNTGNTGWSIKTFFTDLTTYMDSDMFGLDNFGRNLIVYFVLFISVGIMSYKYGLVSPMAITTMVFGIIYFFDVVIGLLVSPIGAIPNFYTWITGSILAVIIIKEVMTG